MRSPLPSVITCLAFTAVCAGLEGGDSKLRFVDVRLHAGIDQGLSEIDGADYDARTGPVGGLTVMCGDIGSAKQAEYDWAEDLGIVLGARISAVHWEGELGSDQDQEASLEGLSLALVGGLAFTWDDEMHIELCGLYGRGLASGGELKGFEFQDDGDFAVIGGELGIYYTWPNAWQVGGNLGFQRAKIKAEPSDDGDEVAMTAGGLTANLSLGYRF